MDKRQRIPMVTGYEGYFEARETAKAKEAAERAWQVRAAVVCLALVGAMTVLAAAVAR